MNHALPVEGWARRHSSYAVTIARSVITALRDDGPLSAARVQTVIQRANIGADVEKASPFFDFNDGAERVWNFMRLDLAMVIKEDVHGHFYVDPQLREAYSPAGGFKIVVPPKEEQEVARAIGHRETLLRRWVLSRPFKDIWRDGIIKHTDEEVVQMADWIEAIGYVGPPIVEDQNGMIINGHLRAAALAKLGIDRTPYTTTVAFISDMHRLAWIVTSHYQDGKWPTALRDEIKRVINATLRGTGVKMEWPHDLKVVLGALPETVVTVPEVVVEVPEVVDEPPRKGKPDSYPRSFPAYRPVPYDSVGIDLNAQRRDDGSKARLIRRVLQTPQVWMSKAEGKVGSKDVVWHFRRSMWFRFNGQAYLLVPDMLKTTHPTKASPLPNWSCFRIRPLTSKEYQQAVALLPKVNPKSRSDWTQESFDKEYGPLYAWYENLVTQTWAAWGHTGDTPC